MPYKIQQLGLGGILDQAITLVKNHFGLLFQIMLLTWIPWNVVSVGIQLAVLPPPPVKPTPEEVMKYLLELLDYLPVILGLVVMGIYFVVPITNAAAIHAITETYLGRSVTAVESVKKAIGKLVPLLWTSILMGLAVGGGLLLCVIPGILFMLWFGLYQNVVLFESLSGTAALGRSRQLIQPVLGTFFILGLLVFIITSLFASGSLLIPEQHVQLAVTILLYSITISFSAAVTVVFYFSCRCGVDNFDLEHLVTAVGESAPPALEPEAI